MSRWYKRCGADFIHGTMMLTLEEKGAYSLCLDLIYDRGGPIPDDARWLSGVCGVSMRKWNALRDRLISLGKLAADDGHLSNSRAAFELVSSELQRRNQAEAGAKGGRKRAENAGQPLKDNDLAQATLKPIDKSREDKKEEGDKPLPTREVFPQPEWADRQVWLDFRANRKTKRLKDTATAYAGFLSDVARLADDEWPPGRLLELAARKGWGSINKPDEANGRGRREEHPEGRTGAAVERVLARFEAATDRRH